MEVSTDSVPEFELSDTAADIQWRRKNKEAREREEEAQKQREEARMGGNTLSIGGNGRKHARTDKRTQNLIHALRVGERRARLSCTQDIRKGTWPTST